MGGHSKKGGRHGRQQGGKQAAKKTLKKDPGVPDLKDVARKLTATAQRKSHSVMSLRPEDGGAGAEGGGRLLSGIRSSGGGVIGSATAQKMGRVVARSATRQQQQQQQQQQYGAVGGVGYGETGAEESEEVRTANQRRQMAALALRTTEKVYDYEAPLRLYNSGVDDGEGEGDLLLEDVDRRGTDKSLRRFYKAFNRVVESCDVLLQVLDARDPLGCRLTRLEQSVRSSYGDDKKKIVVVLNKVDMLPSKEVVDAWIHYFENQEHLTCIPFAATAKGSIGQSYVHNMFRRLRALARGGDGDGNDRKAIVVGVIGYPNVGKSSIINALKRKNVVGVGNMPGFTTGNTEVELRSDIRVMDCPGVVMPGEDNGDVVLRGAVRVSDLANPFTPVQRLLHRCSDLSDVNLDDDDDNEEGEGRGGGGGGALHRLHPLAQFYGIGSFPSDDAMEFIRLVGQRRGRLTKGGQVDEESTARMILDDWNTGRIAYYTYPPIEDDFFANQGNFRAGGRRGRHHGTGADDDDDEEGRGTSAGAASFVAAMSSGITLDGLPTFHLAMNRVAAGKGSRKKWVNAYQDTQYDDEYDYDEDDDDEDEVL